MQATSKKGDGKQRKEVSIIAGAGPTPSSSSPRARRLVPALSNTKSQQAQLSAIPTVPTGGKGKSEGTETTGNGSSSSVAPLSSRSSSDARSSRVQYADAFETGAPLKDQLASFTAAPLTLSTQLLANADYALRQVASNKKCSLASRLQLLDALWNSLPQSARSIESAFLRSTLQRIAELEFDAAQEAEQVQEAQSAIGEEGGANSPYNDWLSVATGAIGVFASALRRMQQTASEETGTSSESVEAAAKAANVWLSSQVINPKMLEEKAQEGLKPALPQSASAGLGSPKPKQLAPIQSANKASASAELPSTKRNSVNGLASLKSPGDAAPINPGGLLPTSLTELVFDEKVIVANGSSGEIMERKWGYSFPAHSYASVLAMAAARSRLIQLQLQLLTRTTKQAAIKEQNTQFDRSLSEVDKQVATLESMKKKCVQPADGSACAESFDSQGVPSLDSSKLTEAVVESLPVWEEEKTYAAGSIVKYQGDVYTALLYNYGVHPGELEESETEEEEKSAEESAESKKPEKISFQSLLFDGSQVCSFGAPAHLKTHLLGHSFTIDAWVWLNPDDDTTSPVDSLVRWGGFLNITHNNSSIAFQVWTQRSMAVTHVTSGPRGILPRSQWSHIACVFDASKPFTEGLRLFINGRRVGGSTTTPTFVPASQLDASLQLGASATHGQPYEGAIGPIRIWGAALDAAQVKQALNSPTGSGELALRLRAPLLASWSVSNADAGGVAVRDDSGHNLEGRLRHYAELKSVELDPSRLDSTDVVESKENSSSSQANTSSESAFGLPFIPFGRKFRFNVNVTNVSPTSAAGNLIVAKCDSLLTAVHIWRPEANAGSNGVFVVSIRTDKGAILLEHSVQCQLVGVQWVTITLPQPFVMRKEERIFLGFREPAMRVCFANMEACFSHSDIMQMEGMAIADAAGNMSNVQSNNIYCIAPLILPLSQHAVATIGHQPQTVANVSVSDVSPLQLVWRKELTESRAKFADEAACGPSVGPLPQAGEWSGHMITAEGETLGIKLAILHFDVMQTSEEEDGDDSKVYAVRGVFLKNKSGSGLFSGVFEPATGHLQFTVHTVLTGTLQVPMELSVLELFCANSTVNQTVLAPFQPVCSLTKPLATAAAIESQLAQHGSHLPLLSVHAHPLICNLPSNRRNVRCDICRKNLLTAASYYCDHFSHPDSYDLCEECVRAVVKTDVARATGETAKTLGVTQAVVEEVANFKFASDSASTGTSGSSAASSNPFSQLLINMTDSFSEATVSAAAEARLMSLKHGETLTVQAHCHPLMTLTNLDGQSTGRNCDTCTRNIRGARLPWFLCMDAMHQGQGGYDTCFACAKAMLMCDKWMEAQSGLFPDAAKAAITSKPLEKPEEKVTERSTTVNPRPSNVAIPTIQGSWSANGRTSTFALQFQIGSHCQAAADSKSESETAATGSSSTTALSALVPGLVIRAERLALERRAATSGQNVMNAGFGGIAVADTVKGVRILQATYGISRRQIDVTQRVRLQLQSSSHPDLRFQVTNVAMGGDPVPYQVKFCTISFSVNGGATQQIVVQEQGFASFPTDEQRMASDKAASLKAESFTLDSQCASTIRSSARLKRTSPLSLRWIGAHQSAVDTLRFPTPLPGRVYADGAELVYYEMNIDRLAASDRTRCKLAIGFATSTTNSDEIISISSHGALSSQPVLIGSEWHDPGSSWSEGETVGVGFDRRSRILFFTRNGKFLCEVKQFETLVSVLPVITFTGMLPEELALGACVGITLNFGATPFKFAVGALKTDSDSSSAASPSLGLRRTVDPSSTILSLQSTGKSACKTEIDERKITLTSPQQVVAAQKWSVFSNQPLPLLVLSTRTFIPHPTADQCMALGSRPVVKKSLPAGTAQYFEIKVGESMTAGRCFLSIGFARMHTASALANRWPGEVLHSFGWTANRELLSHLPLPTSSAAVKSEEASVAEDKKISAIARFSDNQLLFAGEYSTTFGPAWRCNDILGAGIDTDSRTAFFTINGRIVLPSIALQLDPRDDTPWHAVIGLSNLESTTIQANFEGPFAWDSSKAYSQSHSNVNIDNSTARFVATGADSSSSTGVKSIWQKVVSDPNALLQRCFSFLPLVDLSCAAAVNKQFLSTSKHPFSWQFRSLNRFLLDDIDVNETDPIVRQVQSVAITSGSRGAASSASFSKDGIPEVASHVEPVARINFADSNSIPATSRMLNGASIENGVLVLPRTDSYFEYSSVPFSVTAKTLVSVVALNSLDLRGGSALSIVRAFDQVFDGIVFGERVMRRWIAGSDNFRRTSDVQGIGAVDEDTPSSKFIHMAITYTEDGIVTLYRNGVPYGNWYRTLGVETFPAIHSKLLIGLRHDTGQESRLAGRVKSVAVYNCALTPRQVYNLYEVENNVTTISSNAHRPIARSVDDLNRAGFAMLLQSFRKLKHLQFQKGTLHNLLASSRDHLLPALVEQQRTSPLCSGAGEHELTESKLVWIGSSKFEDSLQRGDEMVPAECFTVCLNCACIVHCGTATNADVKCARGQLPHVVGPRSSAPTFRVRCSSTAPPISSVTLSGAAAGTIRTSDWRVCKRCACLFHEADAHNRMCAAGALDDSVPVNTYAVEGCYYSIDHEQTVAPKGVVNEGLLRCARCDCLVLSQQVNQAAAEPEHDSIQLLINSPSLQTLESLKCVGPAQGKEYDRLHMLGLNRLMHVLSNASWASSALSSLELFDLRLGGSNGSLQAHFSTLASASLPKLRRFAWSATIIETPASPSQIMRIGGPTSASASGEEVYGEVTKVDDMKWCQILFVGQSARIIKKPCRLTQFSCKSAPTAQGLPAPINVSSWRPTRDANNQITSWTRVGSWTANTDQSSSQSSQSNPPNGKSELLRPGRYEGHMLLQSLTPLILVLDVQSVEPLGDTGLLNVDGLMTLTSTDKRTSGTAKISGQILDSTVNLKVGEVQSGMLIGGPKTIIGHVAGETLTGVCQGDIIGQVNLTFSATQAKSLVQLHSIPSDAQWLISPGDVLAINTTATESGSAAISHRNSSLAEDQVVRFCGISNSAPNPSTVASSAEATLSMSGDQSVRVESSLQLQMPIQFSLVEADLQTLDSSSSQGQSAVNRFFSKIGKQLESLHFNVQSTPSLPFVGKDASAAEISLQQDALAQLLQSLSQCSTLQELTLVAAIAPHHLTMLEHLGSLPKLQELYLRLSQSFNLPLPTLAQAANASLLQQTQLFSQARNTAAEQSLSLFGANVTNTAGGVSNPQFNVVDSWPIALSQSDQSVHGHDLQYSLDMEGHNCNVCRRGMSGAGYRCHPCDFDAHAQCAFQLNRTGVWKYPSISATRSAFASHVESMVLSGSTVVATLRPVDGYPAKQASLDLNNCIGLVSQRLVPNMSGFFSNCSNARLEGFTLVVATPPSRFMLARVRKLDLDLVLRVNQFDQVVCGPQSPDTARTANASNNVPDARMIDFLADTRKFVDAEQENLLSLFTPLPGVIEQVDDSDDIAQRQIAAAVAQLNTSSPHAGELATWLSADGLLQLEKEMRKKTESRNSYSLPDGSTLARAPIKLSPAQLNTSTTALSVGTDSLFHRVLNFTATKESDSSYIAEVLPSSEWEPGCELLAKDFTFSAWLYPDARAAANSSSVIMSHCSGSHVGLFQVSLSSGGIPQFERGEQTISAAAISHAGSSALPLQEWSHLTIVSRAASVLIYVNGKLTGEPSDPPEEPFEGEAAHAAAHSVAHSHAFRIGSTTASVMNAAAVPFTGRMAQIRLYSRALTRQELTALASKPKPISEATVFASSAAPAEAAPSSQSSLSASPSVSSSVSRFVPSLDRSRLKQLLTPGAKDLIVPEILCRYVSKLAALRDLTIIEPQPSAVFALSVRHLSKLQQLRRLSLPVGTPVSQVLPQRLHYECRFADRTFVPSKLVQSLLAQLPKLQELQVHTPTTGVCRVPDVRKLAEKRKLKQFCVGPALLKGLIQSSTQANSSVQISPFSLSNSRGVSVAQQQANAAAANGLAPGLTRVHTLAHASLQLSSNVSASLHTLDLRGVKIDKLTVECVFPQLGQLQIVRLQDSQCGKDVDVLDWISLFIHRWNKLQEFDISGITADSVWPSNLLLLLPVILPVSLQILRLRRVFQLPLQEMLEIISMQDVNRYWREEVQAAIDATAAAKKGESALSLTGAAVFGFAPLSCLLELDLRNLPTLNRSMFLSIARRLVRCNDILPRLALLRVDRSAFPSDLPLPFHPFEGETLPSSWTMNHDCITSSASLIQSSRPNLRISTFAINGDANQPQS